MRNDLIDSYAAEKLMTSDIGEALRTSNPKTPKLYMLPKEHKPNNTGWSVVSSVACHSCLISIYVDYHLNPVAQRLCSYVRDTIDFLNKSSTVNDLPTNTVRISMGAWSFALISQQVKEQMP